MDIYTGRTARGGPVPQAPDGARANGVPASREKIRHNRGNGQGNWNAKSSAFKSDYSGYFWRNVLSIAGAGLIAAAGAAQGQTTIGGNQVRGILPVVNELPGTCTPGGLNDAVVLSAGTILYTCTGPNAYTAVAGNGGQNGVAIESDGVAAAGSPAGTFNVVAGTGVICIPQVTSGTMNLQCNADTAYLASKTTLQGATNPQICISSSGSGSAYTAACATTLTGYAAKQTLFWYADVSNTTTQPALNIDTLGAAVLVAQNGQALQVGSIAAATLYRIWYDGASMRVAEASSGAGGGGITLTANPGTCTVTGIGNGAACVVSTFSGQNVGEVTITTGTGTSWPGAGNDFMTLTWGTPWASVPHCVWSPENGGESGGDLTQQGANVFVGNSIFWHSATSTTTSGSLSAALGGGFPGSSVLKLTYQCF